MVLRSPSQCPLLMAAVVALLGVGLIVISSVWPAGLSGSEAHARAIRTQDMYDTHLRALAELGRAGVSGSVDVVDFGDGLGLGVSQNVPAGAVLLQVPEAFSFDTENTRSCPGDGPLSTAERIGDGPGVDCQIERFINKAVANGEVSRLTGLIAVLVVERRRGLVEGLKPTAATAALAVLPETSWQAESGIFSIDEEEFRIFSTGTSMDGWQQAALKETSQAHEIISRAASKFGFDTNIGLDEVRWAYLVLMSNAQWVEDDSNDDGLGFPSKALFLLPLLLSRPTPEWEHGVQIRHNRAQKVYEVIALRPMRPGEEIHFVDRRLSDASVLCYRGLHLVGQHRTRVALNVTGIPRDQAAQPTLDKYGCGAQPLRLYLHAQKHVDFQFLGCMRMLALASNSSKLRKAEKARWLDKWPETGMVDRRTEATATELAVQVLQQTLWGLGASSADIRQRYGTDTVATRPTIKVREAETMIVVGLLKSMKELQLVSSNEYLFETLRNSPGEGGKKKASKQARSGDGGYPDVLE